jgi:hypothetical protein
MRPPPGCATLFLAKLLGVLALSFPFSCAIWLCSTRFVVQLGSSAPPLSEVRPPEGYQFIAGDRDAWHRALPACPCQLPKKTDGTIQTAGLSFGAGWSAEAKSLNAPNVLGFFTVNFHPGGVWEIRWLDPRLTGTGWVDDLFNPARAASIPVFSGQQCIYDKNGQLITGGIAAGTPDRWGFQAGDAGDAVGHTALDVIPFLPGWLDYVLGGTDNGRLRWYLENWPPNQGRGCPPCPRVENEACRPDSAPGADILPIGLVVLVLGLALLAWGIAALIGLLIRAIVWLIRLPFRLIGWLFRLIFRRG